MQLPSHDYFADDPFGYGMCEHLHDSIGPCVHCDHPAYLQYLEDSENDAKFYETTHIPDYDTRPEEAARWAEDEWFAHHPPCWWIPLVQYTEDGMSVFYHKDRNKIQELATS